MRASGTARPRKSTSSGLTRYVRAPFFGGLEAVHDRYMDIHRDHIGTQLLGELDEQ